MLTFPPEALQALQAMTWPGKALRRGSLTNFNFNEEYVGVRTPIWQAAELSMLTSDCLLCSAYDHIIPARGRAVVKTDLAIAIPSGTYARVAPRSGLAVKHFIDTGAGVVDEDYRGNVGVVLFNHSELNYKGRLRHAFLTNCLNCEVISQNNQNSALPVQSPRVTELHS